MSLAECVLHNDVKDGLANSVLIVYEGRVEESLCLRRLLDDNRAWLALVDRLDVDILFNRLHREDHLTRGSVRAHDLIDEAMLRSQNVMDARGIENLVGDDAKRVLVHVFLEIKTQPIVVAREWHIRARAAGRASTTPAATATATAANTAATTASTIITSWSV